MDYAHLKLIDEISKLSLEFKNIEETRSELYKQMFTISSNIVSLCKAAENNYLNKCYILYVNSSTIIRPIGSCPTLKNTRYFISENVFSYGNILYFNDFISLLQVVYNNFLIYNNSIHYSISDYLQKFPLRNEKILLQKQDTSPNFVKPHTPTIILKIIHLRIYHNALKQGLSEEEIKNLFEIMNSSEENEKLALTIVGIKKKSKK